MDFNLVGAAEEGLRSSLSQFGAPSAWRFSDFGACLRCQTLKRLGFNQRTDRLSLKSLFNMEMGHVIEREALEWLSRSTNVDILSKQVKVALPQYGAKGTMDALGKLGNNLVPIEIKSTRDKALTYRIPYKNHEKQARGYAWAINLPRAILLYIGRDGTFAQCWVENDQAGRDAIAADLDKLNLYWDSMPDRKEGQSDEDFYQDVEPYLPPAPKVVLEPVLNAAGEPELYQRAGPWGPKGTPKTQIANDGSCVYCKFESYCCMSQDREDVSINVLGQEVDTTSSTGMPQREAGRVSTARESEDGTNRTSDETSRTEKGPRPPAKIKTDKGWQTVPQETWLAAIEREKLANSGTQTVPAQQGH